MNFFFINSIAPPVWGGGEKWMQTAAAGLQHRGHYCCCCGQPDSLFLQNCAGAGLPVLPLRVRSDFGIENIFRLARFFKHKQIDIIIANFNKDVRLAGCAKRLSGVPLLIARNGLPILRNSLVYRLTYKIFADAILTNTLAIKERYLSYGWLNDSFIHVIHNGIAVDQQIVFDRSAVLRKYNLSGQRPIIGFFGRLVSQKQPDKFLEIASRIIKQFPAAKLIFAGDGPLRENILMQADRAGLSRHIQLLGAQKNVMELYSVCDLVMLTSQKEGLPNVVMEAMLAARPVVAFAAGGVEELIPSPAQGRVVPVDDVEGAAARALEILNSAPLSAQIGQEARRYIIDNFSVEKMISRIEQLCSGLL